MFYIKKLTTHVLITIFFEKNIYSEMERTGFKSSVGGKELSDTETVPGSEGMKWHLLTGKFK